MKYRHCERHVSPTLCPARLTVPRESLDVVGPFDEIFEMKRPHNQLCENFVPGDIQIK